MRLAELVSLFEQWNRQHKKPRTADFYRDELRKVVARYGELDAAELRPFHFLTLRMTWHLVLSVQRLYRWAVDEMDLLTSNPVKKLKRPRLGSRRRTLSPAELLRLLRAARPDFRRLLLFARESAARPQELVTVRWDELRWDGDAAQVGAELRAGRAFFMMIDYKGRTRRADPHAPRIVPITPRLGRMLERLRAGRQLAGPVLLTDDGKEWNRNSVRMRMRRLAERCQLGGRVGGERVVCYTFRHSAATSLAARGFQTSVLQSLLGHANIRTTQRYVHLHRKQLMDTWRDFWQKRPRPGEK